jgi:hypothetical protein
MGVQGSSERGVRARLPVENWGGRGPLKRQRSKGEHEALLAGRLR